MILSWHGKFLYEKFNDILNAYTQTEELIVSDSTKDIISLGLSENAKTRYYGSELVAGLLAQSFTPEIYLGPSRNIYEKVLFGTLEYGIVGNKTSRG